MCRSRVKGGKGRWMMRGEGGETGERSKEGKRMGQTKGKTTEERAFVANKRGRCSTPLAQCWR